MSTATLDLAMHTKHIAALARIWGTALPALCAVEDLEQVGWEALLRCLPRYEPRRGPFATYAHWRMRGAMQDEQRRCDPRTRYAQTHGVPPCTFVPVDARLPDATPAATPEPFLAAAVAALPARQQAVLRLSYVEGWWLHEIADALGCTESRVSQIRTQALATLRLWLKEPA